jgi:hypothetical protein
MLLTIGVLTASHLASIFEAWGRVARTLRSPGEVLPSFDEIPPPAAFIMSGGSYEALSARTVKANDSADLMRMDTEGGWHLARRAAMTHLRRTAN